jgi:hypothetical protein
MAVTGHPLLPYAPAGQSLYPNANGPLALVPLALIGAVLNALGSMDSLQLRRALTYGVTAIFLLLMAREGLRAIEQMRGRRLDGRTRVTLYAALTIAPTLWQGVAGYGHVEQPIELWLVLLGARWTVEGRMLLGGAALGLACLARSSAALFVIPLVAMAQGRGISKASRLVASAVAVVALGLLPFLLADAPNVVHSLVTYRGELLVGAGSAWSLTRGTPLESIGQHADILFVIALALALNVWLMRGGRLYAALAVTAASYALLAKTMWPYYLVEVYVLTLVWLAGRRGALSAAARYAPAALVTALAAVGEIGVLANQSQTLIRVEALFMVVVLGGLTVWIARTA